MFFATPAHCSKAILFYAAVCTAGNFSNVHLHSSKCRRLKNLALRSRQKFKSSKPSRSLRRRLAGLSSGRKSPGNYVHDLFLRKRTMTENWFCVADLKLSMAKKFSWLRMLRSEERRVGKE